VVLVFDGSVSMGLPLDIPDALEAELDRRMDQGDESARTEYRRWLAMDKPKRMDIAKGAVGAMLADANSSIKVGAVSFTACREIATHPFVPFVERGQIGGFISSVTPHRGGDTPLASSIEAALGLLRGEGPRGRIVVLTDGQETCGGNLCALAADIAKNQPQVRVDVVQLKGQSDAACLTQATHGQLINYTVAPGGIPLGRLLLRETNQCPVGVAADPGR
jgi:hypothetical protein